MGDDSKAQSKAGKKNAKRRAKKREEKQAELSEAGVSSLAPKLSEMSLGEKMAIVINYREGNLFDSDETESLAHCISADGSMSKGIASQFRLKFGHMDHVKRQGRKPGEIAVLIEGKRYIYNLVTKENYFDKPTNETVKASLQLMKDHCLESGVKVVSMPEIGCGLDKLKWHEVSAIITELFFGTGIRINVYRSAPPASSKPHFDNKS